MAATLEEEAMLDLRWELLNEKNLSKIACTELQSLASARQFSKTLYVHACHGFKHDSRIGGLHGHDAGK